MDRSSVDTLQRDEEQEAASIALEIAAEMAIARLADPAAQETFERVRARYELILARV